MHGENLVSFGFAFSLGKSNVVYLSDISRMLPETHEYIHDKLGPTDVLIVDALSPDKTHTSHFCASQAVALWLVN